MFAVGHQLARTIFAMFFPLVKVIRGRCVRMYIRSAASEKKDQARCAGKEQLWISENRQITPSFTGHWTG